jgi:hypothetical protein
MFKWAEDFNKFAPYSADFTIGAEAANAITVNIQLKNVYGENLTTRNFVQAYLAGDANGDTLEAASGTLSVAAGTDGALSELAADNTFLLISESDGDIDVVITDTVGANTMYLVLCLPGGKIVASSAITFA